MNSRESFLLRIDPKTLDLVRIWADESMRSTNAHIEYVLKEALRAAGRYSNQPTIAQPQAPSVSASSASTRS